MDTTRRTRMETVKAIAEVIAQRSTCSRLQVGAVIHREGRILSTGYNGAPSGVEHCNHACDCIAGPGMEIPRALHQPDCRSFKPCSIATHAERNAIDWAARYGVALMHTQLYTTNAPCYGCAGSIINAGISEVIFTTPFRDMSGAKLLQSTGITIWQWSNELRKHV